MAQARDIGIDVTPPSRECNDAHCPFHGAFPVRGQQIVGQILSNKMQGSVIVRREYLRYMPKFERYEKRTSRYTAHLPACIDVNVGDQVTIMECRPISKTKQFVLIEAKRGQLRVKGDDFTIEDVSAAARPTPKGAKPKKAAAPKEA